MLLGCNDMANRLFLLATPTAPSLFAAPKPVEKDAAAASTTAGLGLGPKPAGATITPTPAAPSTTAANTAVVVPAPSILRGKTIEEIVTRWSSELDTHVAEFNSFANDVAAWDRALIQNGNNVSTLSVSTHPHVNMVLMLAR
jgi:nuclear pore complex protein Nup62